MVTYIIIQRFLYVLFLKLCSTFISCLEFRRGCWIPGTDIKDSCKLPCGFLESKLAPSQELPVFFNYWAISPAIFICLISCMFIRKSKQRLTSYLYGHHLSNMAENSDYLNRKESLCLYSNLTVHSAQASELYMLSKLSFLRSNS